MRTASANILSTSITAVSVSRGNNTPLVHSCLSLHPCHALYRKASFRLGLSSLPPIRQTI